MGGRDRRRIWWSRLGALGLKRPDWKTKTGENRMLATGSCDPTLKEPGRIQERPALIGAEDSTC